MRNRVRWTTLALTRRRRALSARAGRSTHFSSSFEPAIRSPTWTTRPSARQEASPGPSRARHPRQRHRQVVPMKASGENPPAARSRRTSSTATSDTKWLDFEPTGWVAARARPAGHRRPLRADLGQRRRRARPARLDPAGLRTTAQPGRRSTRRPARTSPTASRPRSTTSPTAPPYKYYRLDITANHGDGIVQLAELQLSDGDTTPPPPPDMRALVGGGPRSGPTPRPAPAGPACSALRYAGGHTADGRGYAYDKVFDVDVQVTRDTELSYLIFPELTRRRPRLPEHVRGRRPRASPTAPTSRPRTRATSTAPGSSPQGQGASKTLYANQWNRKVARASATSRPARRSTASSSATTTRRARASFGGWIDDIDDRPRRPGSHARAPVRLGDDHARHQLERLLLARQQHPRDRGAARLQLLDADDRRRLDELALRVPARQQRRQPAELQAFAASHEPSPWMGDRQTFQVMPSPAPARRTPAAAPARWRSGTTTRSPGRTTTASRSRTGCRTEIAPTDHAALFRFTFPGDDGEPDLRQRQRRRAAYDRPGRGVVTGWSDVAQRALQRRDPAVRLRRRSTSRSTRAGCCPTAPAATGYVAFDARRDREHADRDVADQRRPGQAQPRAELAPADTLDDRRARARRAVGRQARRHRGPGRHAGPATTLYSNLYRLNLYPNSAFENTGTRAPALPARHAVLDRHAAEHADRDRRAGGPARSNQFRSSDRRGGMLRSTG